MTPKGVYLTSLHHFDYINGKRIYWMIEWSFTAKHYDRAEVLLDQITEHVSDEFPELELSYFILPEDSSKKSLQEIRHVYFAYNDQYEEAFIDVLQRVSPKTYK